MNDTAPTVFVVDDDPAMRDSLKELVESGGFFVRTFGSAKEFLDEWTQDQAGCLVLDLRIPGMSGLELQESLQDRSPPLPVIVVTGYGTIAAASQSFRMGAVDFLAKPFLGQLLLERIHQAIARDAAARRKAAVRADIANRMNRLSDRERAILDLAAAGLPNKSIAHEMGISIRTVEDHRARIMKKLGVSTFAHLIQLYTHWKSDNG